MILYHTTPVKNLASIRTHGLDPAKSKGKRQVVWLHSRCQRIWALKHLSDCGYERPLTKIKVDVSRSWLRRRRCGIWTCDHLIPPERLDTTPLDTWLDTLQDYPEASIGEHNES